MSDEIQAEFATCGNVRFLDAGALYDSSGNEVFCACGNPAGSAIISPKGHRALCTRCMYGIDEAPVATFVYKEPKSPS